MGGRKTSAPGKRARDPSFPCKVWLQSRSAARLRRADLLAYLVALSRRPKRAVAKVWTQKESPTTLLPLPSRHRGR